MDNKLVIPVSVKGDVISLTIYGESSSNSTLFQIPHSDATENGESEFQLVEGNFYEYQLSSDEYYLNPSEIISNSKFKKSFGRIAPNIYVGTLTLEVLDARTNEKCGEVKIEVQSSKTTYREDYRQMLGDITEKCTELLLQPNSPVNQLLEVDFSKDARTLYQQFAFVKSMIESDEFTEAVHKVVSAPITKWREMDVERDVRSVKKFSASTIRQFAGRKNRIELPATHELVVRGTLRSVPTKIQVSYKRDTVDTPENRFVKFALTSFQSFCRDLLNRDLNFTRLEVEADALIKTLDQHLGHSMFKEVNDLTMVPLNSPVLQRKEGYREILRIWLMFDLAAKLIWQGGEDVYSGGKRDVATLYEYWLFFKLLDVVKDVFHVEPKSVEELIAKTQDGLGLQLKQGKHVAIQGTFLNDIRKLDIQFSYNRTFPGKREYPQGGSWTRELRPDYTLTIWPSGIEQQQAELEELIVHVHFDAKYRVENLNNFLDATEEIDLTEEKEEQTKGNYKRADLLKMHAYRDAIRRTAGAYVLYPGSKSEKIIGFHEIIPGLGAFAISPSKQSDGTTELKIFLQEITQHFLNRASQREQLSLKTYVTFKQKPDSEVKEALPETYGSNRSLLPGETSVLIAFYKNQEHLEWILKNNLYNARTGRSKGSLRLEASVTDASYLLLHGKGELQTGKLFKLRKGGPRIFSKEEIIELKYPDPHHDFYLMFDIAGAAEDEFRKYKWDISLLEKHGKGRDSALPYSVTLAELMQAKC
jgi:hypothetical protein